MRSSILPEYAALVFAALGRVDELTDDERSYVRDCAEEVTRRFIAPGAGIAPEDQLAFNVNFLRVLGLVVPELTDDQRCKVFGAAAAHPDWRILAVPQLDTRGRHEVAERARRLLPNDFNTGQPVIRPPDDGTIIRELTETENLEGTVSRDGSHYVVRYRSSGGQLLPRTTYIDDLVAQGEAVRAADGRVWTFLVGDIRACANDNYPVSLSKGDSDQRLARHKADTEFYARTYADELLAARSNAGELYEIRWRELPSTEALIIMVLIHNAAREPNRTYDINLANETVHELTRDGRVAEDPRYLTTVRFRTQDSRIGHYARERLSKRDYFYVRPFINAFTTPRGPSNVRASPERTNGET